jgi:peptide methionine sulfoxide reductase msrA/msrB
MNLRFRTFPFHVIGCMAVVLAWHSMAEEPIKEATPVKPESSKTEAKPAANAKVYSKPSDAELAKKLNEIQYQVTQKSGTELPFQNEYWNNHESGLYVDIVTGEPLFSSKDKFNSGTGWPSFTQSVEKDRIKEITDSSHGMTRVEVRSKAGDSHLGHIFDDGPAPTGKRYCINSAALRFIPLDKLQAEGYGQYKGLIEGTSTTEPKGAKELREAK